MITAHPRAGLYTLNLKRWLLYSISAYKHFILHKKQDNKTKEEVHTAIESET